MQRNLAGHQYWIVPNNSTKVLGSWADGDEELLDRLRTRPST